jgi:hypothetical protein
VRCYGDNEADTIARLAATTGNGQGAASIGITYSSSSPQHSGLSTIYRVSGKVLAIGLDIALMVARGVYRTGAGELKTWGKSDIRPKFATRERLPMDRPSYLFSTGYILLQSIFEKALPLGNARSRTRQRAVFLPRYVKNTSC